MTQVRKVDSKGRLTLGVQYAGRTIVIPESLQDGPLMLQTVPDQEAWLYRNPEALASVLCGLEQAARREFVPGPTTPDLADHKKSR